MGGKYGTFMWAGKRYASHRVACEMQHGPLGELFACHTCDNPRCCNPRHFFPGTKADNFRDMRAKGRSRPCGGKWRKGVEQSQAILTDDIVRDLRQRHTNGATITAAAAALGVPRNAAKMAIHRRTWKHVN